MTIYKIFFTNIFWLLLFWPEKRLQKLGTNSFCYLIRKLPRKNRFEILTFCFIAKVSGYFEYILFGWLVNTEITWLKLPLSEDWEKGAHNMWFGGFKLLLGIIFGWSDIELLFCTNVYNSVWLVFNYPVFKYQKLRKNCSCDCTQVLFRINYFLSYHLD